MALNEALVMSQCFFIEEIVMDKIIPFLKNITTTDLIALGGLIIASISLGWNMLNEIRKTPRAKVTAMVAEMVQQVNPESGKHTYLDITITNIGSRPLRINGVGYDGYKWWWLPHKIAHFMIVPRALPKTLNDGEQHTEFEIYKPEQFQELLDNNINRLYAWDTSGRKHSMSRLRMLRLKEDIHKHLKDEATKKQTKKGHNNH